MNKKSMSKMPVQILNELLREIYSVSGTIRYLWYCDKLHTMVIFYPPVFEKLNNREIYFSRECTIRL